MNREKPHDSIIEVTKLDLESIVKKIAKHPNRVKVEAKTWETGVSFYVYCLPEDLPVLIGKQGTMAGALRTILHSLTSKRGFKAQLTIAE